MKIEDLLSANIEYELARRHLINYQKIMWSSKEPYIDGRHISEIAFRLEKAIEDYQKGISSFLVFSVPFRHGKSELISRTFPSWAIGKLKEVEILVASYSQTMANRLSTEARDKINYNKFSDIFEGFKLKADTRNKLDWKIEYQNFISSTHWAGVGGAITGSGYQIGIVDDYLKGRADAESRLMRDRIWEWFTNVFLTRRAPVSITIVLGTRWHKDDLIGRIIENKKDKHFPQFEIKNYKAISDDGIYLFPERFSEEWYQSQKTALGSYGFASLMQGEPTLRGGALLKIDKINIVDDIPNIKYVWSWDLASTLEGDYTVGVKMGIDGDAIYIADAVIGKWEAPKRNMIIKEKSKGYDVYIETVGGYLDAGKIIQDEMKGISIVKLVKPKGNKEDRASLLEIKIDGGLVNFKRGDWNDHVLNEMADFPTGAHDDSVDAISQGLNELVGKKKKQVGVW